MSIPEIAFNELFCLNRFQVLTFYEFLYINFLLFLNIAFLDTFQICISIDTVDEVFNKFLFTSKLHTGTNGLIDADKYLLVHAITFMVLLKQKKNIVYVDFYLSIELSLKYKVIIYVFLISFYPLSLFFLKV